MNQAKNEQFETPQIELHGNCRIIIDECDGIMEYEPETIKLRSGRRCLRVNGRNLNLCNLTDRTIMIRGIISQLEFEV